MLVSGYSALLGIGGNGVENTGLFSSHPGKVNVGSFLKVHCLHYKSALN